MKRLGIILLLNIFLACSPAYTFSSPIPAQTLQIAREAELKQAARTPSSEVIRVGIGDTGFKTYVYKQTGVFGTGEIMICDDDRVVETVPADTVVNIKFAQDKGFSLTFEDGKDLTSVSGSLRILCPEGLLGVKGLKRAGKQALYHGVFEIIPAKDGLFNIVNLIELEEYLKGVVPNEMPVHFGLEALKAQSVAARNYVLSPRVKSSPNYDVVDSVASQVYFGANTEKPLSNQAVKETEGVVALYNWDLILAQYSSTAGGYTEDFANAFSDPTTKEFPSKEKPYLKARPDILTQSPLNTEEAAAEYYKSKTTAYDMRSPYFRWTREWTADELQKTLQDNLAAQSATGFVSPAFNKDETLGKVTDIRVVRRGNSGKIIEMEIVTDSQTYKIYKELVIRRLLKNAGKALPSANVVFELQKDENENLVSVKAYGGGFGHGVGMSQYGAGFMDKELHLSYDKILQHYYTGVTLGTKPVIISSDPSQLYATQHFYAPYKKAVIVVDNKFMVTKLMAEINGEMHTFDLPPALLGANRFTEIDISKYIKRGKNTIVFSSPDFADSAFRKALRLYVELVKKDDKFDIW